jgi:hypothetical protein
MPYDERSGKGSGHRERREVADVVVRRSRSRKRRSRRVSVSALLCRLGKWNAATRKWAHELPIVQRCVRARMGDEQGRGEMMTGWFAL